MKFALLGLDDDSLELARAVSQSDEHELAWLCGYEMAAAELVESLRAIARTARVADDWSVLCEPGTVDAVIVARSGDEEARSDALRRLVQQRIPVLAVHPVVDSMLVYYELDMIRRETGCPMMPYLPGRWHPAAQQIAAWLSTGTPSELGTIEQLTLERHMQDRGKRPVLDQFAHDIDLIRFLCGDVNRIGAIGVGADELAYSNLSVHLSGPREIPVRWSVAPVDQREEARLSVIGTTGRAVLVMPASGEWKLQLPNASGAEPPVDNWPPSLEAIQRFAAVVSGQTVSPDWVDAARSIELTEAIERSLRKGRTLELHFEDFTEEGTFKGTMTSVGCGLLIGGLILIVLIAILDSLGLPHLGNWPALLLGLMGLFLILQLITLSFGKEKQPADSRRIEPDDESP
jgi:predicted dehydrogenase